MPNSRVRVRRARWFRLALLAAAIEPRALDVLAGEVSQIGRTVSTQPVRDFIAQDMPIFVERTLAIKRPEDLGLHIELLLFHRAAANVDWTAKRLQGETVVS